jgi:hypothetical protein
MRLYARSRTRDLRLDYRGRHRFGRGGHGFFGRGATSSARCVPSRAAIPPRRVASPGFWSARPRKSSASDGESGGPEPVAGLRFAPSGLQALALPDGQNTQTLGQSAPPKYSTLPKFGNGVCFAHSGPGKRGVSRSSRTRAGRRWTWVTSARRVCRAGNREQRRRAHDRCDLRTAKSCGPGARGLCAKARGDACGPTGLIHQSSARRRGQ